MLGYTPVEPTAVLATHLQEIVRRHADELLTRDATKHLIDELKKTSPAVVDELIPSPMKLADVQQVLQMLLREEVPIRQLSLILETLGDYAGKTKDLVFLTEYVRHRLARTICTRYRDAEGRLFVLTLDPGAGRQDRRRHRAHRAGPVHPHVAADDRKDLRADRPRAAQAHAHRQAADRARQPAGSRRPQADDRRQPAAAGRAELQRNHPRHESGDRRHRRRFLTPTPDP